MFDQFTQLVSEATGWAYGIIFLFAVFDAVIPIFPSETAVITAGVVAAAGDLSLALVIACGAAGAFAGDNGSYWLGRRFGARVRERFFSGEKAQRRITWAEDQLAARGGVLIAIARFIPGGRTAITLTAGTVHYPWRRFVFFDGIAAVIWASYAALLGYFGGHTFENDPWKGLLLALGIAFTVAGLTEGIRWLRDRRSPA